MREREREREREKWNSDVFILREIFFFGGERKMESEYLTSRFIFGLKRIK